MFEAGNRSGRRKGASLVTELPTGENRAPRTRQFLRMWPRDRGDAIFDS